MRKVRTHIIHLILLMVCAHAGLAEVSLPMPTHYVEDKAEIISLGHEQLLNELLYELELKTGVQFIVLTIDSTYSVPIEQYSLALANQWALGQKDVDNGFLFTVAYLDHKYRFEVGYGLERVLTERYLDRLGAKVLTPAMQGMRSSEGVYLATLAVANQLAVHYGVSLSGVPAEYADPVKVDFGTTCIVWGLPLLVFGFMILGITGRGSVLWPIWLIRGRRYDGSLRDSFSSSREGFWGYGHGSYGGGGGFGNGSSGGFGGGSGGSFGGSGSTGGW